MVVTAGLRMQPARGQASCWSSGQARRNGAASLRDLFADESQGLSAPSTRSVISAGRSDLDGSASFVATDAGVVLLQGFDRCGALLVGGNALGGGQRGRERGD